MKGIFEKSSELLNRATPEILSQIASTQRSFREKAIHALIGPLDEKSETDSTIIGTIPLELIERGDVVWAIWYIETLWRLWNALPWEIVARVYRWAVLSGDTLVLHWEQELANTVSSSLDALFQMARIHPIYKDNTELYLLMGEHEERKGKPLKAILYYQTVIEHGDIEWYIAVANAQESMGKYEASLVILESWWSIHHDLKILSKIISTLCKIGKTNEALERYAELKKWSDGKIVPFLVYKWNIETDAELGLLEDIIADYITERSFIPMEVLALLAASWSLYIKESIRQINDAVGVLNHKTSQKDWSHEDQIEYVHLIQQRLWLMQIDILTLWNHRYIDHYIANLRELWLKGDVQSKNVLDDFFTQYFSKEVEHEMRVRSSKNQSTGTESIQKDKEEEMRIGDTNTLLENISLHISRIGELFSQGSFHDTYRDDIIPLLRDCAQIEGEYDEKMETKFSQSLSIIKDQHDYYHSLRRDVRESYENFIHQFDMKYGVFYRKHIQFLAIDPEVTSDAYPLALREYIEIAFLFWVEKLMAGKVYTNDPEKIEEIVQEYSLEKLDISNALLFWTLLYDVSVKYAISFLVHYPHILDVPQVIYIVTEGLRSMESKTRKLMIKDLHELTREDYGARGFFEHIKYTFDDISKNELTGEDMQYMYLSQGNVAILQRKEKIESIMNFRTASEYGSLEWLLRAGDSYKDAWEYAQALNLFERALCYDSSILVMTKILDCTISSAQFDKAQKYIDLALRQWYSIGNYIIAFHLWQWNTRLAFIHTLSMIWKGISIIDMPEWLLKLLFETIYAVHDMKATPSWEENELKIYASFIATSIIYDGVLPDSTIFLNHWDDITSLCDSCEWDTLYEKLKKSLEPIVWDMDMDESNFSLSEISIDFLETHAQNIYETLHHMLNDAQKEGDIAMERHIFTTMNTFCFKASSLLQRFPDADDYIDWWRDKLNISPQNWIINDMPNMVQ